MKIGQSVSRLLVVLVLLLSLNSFGYARGQAPTQALTLPPPDDLNPPVSEEIKPLEATATCGDTMTGNDGHPLDECQGGSFTMGGNTWELSVYYTLDTTAGDDWIITHTQASAIVGWMQEAYQAYFKQTGKTYGASTCSRHIRAKVMEGDGWAGIAWWPNSCSIGLDAPMIRGNGGRHTTLHEMRHKVVQFAYPNCLADWEPDYPGKTTYIVEGDADYGTSTVGDYGYMNSGYSPNKSLQDHGYNNMFSPYYSEHVDLYAGPFGIPGDVDYLAGGMVKHWERCQALGDLHIMRDVIQGNTPYSMEAFFLNFFAALYLHAYADPVTQPELYFYEDDAPSVNVTYSPALESSVNLAAGASHTWSAQSTPATWAGKYYEIRPQAGCPYVMLEGSGSGPMGWAFMAANTTPRNAEYSGWVGTTFSRVFAAHGAHEKVGIAALAYHHNRTYELTARCISPQIEVLRPIAPNYRALVGDPLSPVAFLAYLKVTDGSGTPVTGIPADWFVLDAEGDPVVTDTVSEITKGHYMGVFLPPTKPAGTSMVDLRACLGTSGLCDDNSDALLYVPPGHMDMVLLHDASGSMGWIDVPGDLPRLEQAKRAAELLVMLAQTGDYYGIMDFSAQDVGASCPPTCPHDVRTVYPKTEITNPTTQIPALITAINSMTAREWTNLGEGLRRAQLMVLGAPYNAHNKVVTVLSDGEENVNPMYDDVASELSVVINTMGFSGDAPNDLLARIAAENLGQFLYVSTAPGTALAGTGETERQEMHATVESMLIDEGVAPAQAAGIAALLAPSAVYLPAGLGLRDAYDYRQTEATGASRIASGAYIEVSQREWRVQNATVSMADNALTLVSSSREADYGICSWHRDVEVLRPGGTDKDWIAISPPVSPLPANWDVRNSTYHDVLYVKSPQPGTWQMRTGVVEGICTSSHGPEITTTLAPNATTVSFIQTAKVYSTIRVEGEILLEDKQGRVGDPVPILGTVLTRAGASPGAAVLALIERPGGTQHAFWLRDDGESGDGAAGDGIHGNTYMQAVIGGAYNVTIGAVGYDPFDPGQVLVRMWKGSFYMHGPGPGDDADDDRLPTWWEKLYPCMDPGKYDSPQADYDGDGLINWQEWEYGTNPCNPDTDGGGENDGSEVAGGRNPHWPKDDKVPNIDHWSVRPLNNAALIRWSRPISYTNMLVYLTRPDGRTEQLQGGPTGSLTLTLTNNLVYTVTLQGVTADGVGAPTEPEQVIPKADPDPPSGAVLINYGVPTTSRRDVTLYVKATDQPLDGMPSQASGAVASQWTAMNEVSGDVQMRLRNESAGTWTSWQPFQELVPWQLSPNCAFDTVCTVYAQFRDAALNESLPVADTILYNPHRAMLPLIIRSGP